MDHTQKNAGALAWLDAWYALPDDSPPGYWDEFEAFLQAHPIDFGENVSLVRCPGCTPVDAAGGQAEKMRGPSCVVEIRSSTLADE